MTMATFNEKTGELTVTQAQRIIMARDLSIYRILAKLGDADAAAAVESMAKVVAKYQVKAAK